MAIVFKISGAVNGGIKIDSDDGNVSGNVTYTGDKTGIRLEIDGAFGAFGHRLNLDRTSPIDMDAALKSVKKLQVEILQGVEMVTTYDPKLPKGAIT